jgi:hypothetical protein
MFDLRKAKTERNYGKFDPYFNEVKKSLAKCMAEGGIFIINIDDSEVFYESLYDPDLKEFYNKTHLPS